MDFEKMCLDPNAILKYYAAININLSNHKTLR